MSNKNNAYSNGQPITRLDGNVLTYYFENGEIKAQGKTVNGVMDGKWLFNKKEGYLWQTGSLDKGQKHGEWIRFNKDGSVQNKAYFEQGKQIKR